MKIYTKAMVNSLTLKNRFIRSATYEGGSDRDGNPTDFITGLYKKLADGDVGAIITGYAGVNHQGRTTELMPLFNSDSRIDVFRKTIAYPQQKGVPVILQLAHGGGMAHAKPSDCDMVAPSGYKYPLAKEAAREMTHDEIEQLIGDFVAAIVRAKESGYDGVQIHCAHGYLLSQFLLPKLNRRNDQWGGSIQNRFRIIGEIFKRAREQVGSFQIWAKISAYTADKGNITLEESIETAKMLEAVECDLIEVSCGAFVDGFSTARCPKVPVQAIINLSSRAKSANPFVKLLMSMFLPFAIPCPKPIHNYNVDAAAKIKENVTVPVSVVGGLRERSVMENIVEENKSDFVSLSRPFIIEPGLVQRFRDKNQEKSRCIDCMYCMIGCIENPLRCYYGKIK